MVLETSTVIAIGTVASAVIGWCLHMGLRLSAVERQCYASEAHQRIIITGLVRVGVLQQEEVDQMRQQLRDGEHKRGVVI